MTRDELFAAVRSYADRPDLTEDTLLSVLRTLEGELNRAFAGHTRSLVTASYTLPAQQTLIPLPADIFLLVALRHPSDLVWERRSPGTPVPGAWGEGYIDRGSVLEVIGASEADRVFMLDYHAALCTLADQIGGNWVSVHHADVYVYGMLKELAVWTRDTQQTAIWLPQFAARLEAARMQGWDQNLGAGARTLRS